MFSDTELNSWHVTGLNLVKTSLTTASCLSDVPLVLSGQIMFYKKMVCSQNEKQEWAGNWLGLLETPDFTNIYGLQEQWFSFLVHVRITWGVFKKYVCLDLRPRDTDFIVLGWNLGIGIVFKTFQDSNMQPRWRTGVTSQILRKKDSYHMSHGRWGRLIRILSYNRDFHRLYSVIAAICIEDS